MYNNQPFLNYEAQITILTDSYLAKYFQKIAKENRNQETANEFLKNNQEQFRDAVAKITVGMIHNNINNEEFQKEILEKNSWAISKLAVEVNNASTDNPRWATKI